MSDTPTIFCFGLGYTARALAQRLIAQGWEVRGTSRSAETGARLAEAGIKVWQFDRDRPLDDAAAALDGVSHILSSVPPDKAGDSVIDLHGNDIAARGQQFSWAGYLSTTGVYGDRGGATIDESAELLPSTQRGERRVTAEAGWCDLWRENGVPVHLFRLAGIYGPERNALETIRSGKARRIVKPGQVFSRVHVDDIASVLAASIAKPNPGTAYNVCDDEAAPPQDVITYGCELLGVEPPPEIPFESAELSDIARSFYAENKRVSNARIKGELGVRLAYPNYREGLQALLRAGTG